MPAKKKETKEKKTTKKAVAKKETKAKEKTALEKLKEKAAQLAEGIEAVDTEELKQEVKDKKKTLVELEDYVKTGIHLGTRVITPGMRKFVYRRRADGIAVLNTNLIDDHLKKAIDLIKEFNPEEIVLICKREAGWKAAKLFSEVTGIKSFTKKYPAGMMTNLELEDFNEPQLVIITDPWIDKNALSEAKKTKKKIISLCDTNNFIKDAHIVVPCNNKAGKSLGLIYYIIARDYLKAKKIKNKLPGMDDFVGE